MIPLVELYDIQLKSKLLSHEAVNWIPIEQSGFYIGYLAVILMKNRFNEEMRYMQVLNAPRPPKISDTQGFL